MAEIGGDTALGLRERKKQRTRATLIDAAAELCLRQGYEHTTVDQIAAIADVSPRTFSRYFATKDAIALALIDEVIANAAIELSRQPTDIGHFEALRRSYVAMYYGTKTAPPGGLSSERIMCIVRIILSSAALRHAATEYRRTAVNIELAKRMGVDLDDRKLKLVASIWASLTITALGDLGEDTDWQRVGIDDIVSRMEAAFAEFIELVDDVRQPV